MGAAVGIRLGRAVQLDWGAPFGGRHLPVADGAPFGDHQRQFRVERLEHFREDEHIAVDLDAEKIEVGRAPPDHPGEFGGHPGGGGRGGVVGVELVDHLGDVVHRVVHPGVLVFEIEFVADHPDQQRGMVAVGQYGFPGLLELPGDGFGVVIVEAMAFPGDFNAQRHAQAKLVGEVEHAAVADPPGANRIAAVMRQRFEIAECFRPRAADRIGFAAAIQSEVARPAAYLHRNRPFPGHRGNGKQQRAGHRGANIPRAQPRHDPLLGASACSSSSSDLPRVSGMIRARIAKPAMATRP